MVHTHWIDRLALVNGIFSGIALYPQLFEALYLPHLAGSLSVTTFSIIFLNSIIWLLYGIHRRLISLSIASFLNILAAGSLTLLAFIY